MVHPPDGPLACSSRQLLISWAFDRVLVVLLIDVVIIVGGIDSNGDVFSANLYNYLAQLRYSNIVFVGNELDVPAIEKNIENVVLLPNIIFIF